MTIEAAVSGQPIRVVRTSAQPGQNRPDAIKRESEGE